MNNNSGKRLRNAGYILLGIAMLAAYGVVSTMGLTDLQNDLEQCREMEALWIASSSNGSDMPYGWPPGTCDNIN
jgi:hypothetical protein|tara:strand:- start:225 stop:446 length:222 start_codon:yes stop_codon:yes gene_type:complete